MIASSNGFLGRIIAGISHDFRKERSRSVREGAAAELDGLGDGFGGAIGGDVVREGKIVPPARHVYDERRHRWSGRGLDKVGMAAGSVGLGVDLANGLNDNARHVMQQKRETLVEKGLGRAVAPHRPVVGDAALGSVGHDVTDSVNSGVLAGAAVGRVLVEGGKAHCPDTAQFVLKGPRRILQGRIVPRRSWGDT